MVERRDAELLQRPVRTRRREQPGCYRHRSMAIRWSTSTCAIRRATHFRSSSRWTTCSIRNTKVSGCSARTSFVNGNFRREQYAQSRAVPLGRFAARGLDRRESTRSASKNRVARARSARNIMIARPGDTTCRVSGKFVDRPGGQSQCPDV